MRIVFVVMTLHVLQALKIAIDEKKIEKMKGNQYYLYTITKRQAILWGCN